MKTRNSLVSNSSSSSFILIGEPIEITQLTEKHIFQEIKKSKNEQLRTIIFGGYFGEGQDIFTLSDKKQLQFILDYPHLFKKAFINAIYLYDSSDGYELKQLKTLNLNIDKLILIGGTADQNSSYNIESMIQMYGPSLEKEMKQNFAKKYGVEINNER